MAYIGLLNAGILQFTADPGTYTLAESGTVVASSARHARHCHAEQPHPVRLFLVGLVLTVVLLGAGT